MIKASFYHLSSALNEGNGIAKILIYYWKTTHYWKKHANAKQDSDSYMKLVPCYFQTNY